MAAAAAVLVEEEEEEEVLENPVNARQAATAAFGNFVGSAAAAAAPPPELPSTARIDCDLLHPKRYSRRRRCHAVPTKTKAKIGCRRSSFSPGSNSISRDPLSRCRRNRSQYRRRPFPPSTWSSPTSFEPVLMDGVRRLERRGLQLIPAGDELMIRSKRS